LFPACYASHAFAALVLIGGVVGLLTCFVAAVWWDKKKQLLAFTFMSAGRFFLMQAGAVVFMFFLSLLPR
jgi:hypothetical protein